jgi:hypothetical protein
MARNAMADSFEDALISDLVGAPDKNGIRMDPDRFYHIRDNLLHTLRTAYEDLGNAEREFQSSGLDQTPLGDTIRLVRGVVGITRTGLAAMDANDPDRPDAAWVMSELAKHYGCICEWERSEA